MLRPLFQEQLAQRIADLFQNSPDLLSGLQHFVPREMFSALDSAMSVNRDTKAGKLGKEKSADSASLSVTAPGPQKRKRKAPNREKEKEREREREPEIETPVKATQSKVRIHMCVLWTESHLLIYSRRRG